MNLDILTPAMEEKLRTAQKLRREGGTLRGIGEVLGISGERVRQLLQKAERRVERGPHSLSTRATHLLCHASRAFAEAYYAKQPESSLKELAARYMESATERDLRKANFPCGPKTIAEISAWCGARLKSSKV